MLGAQSWLSSTGRHPVVAPELPLLAGTLAQPVSNLSKLLNCLTIPREEEVEEHGKVETQYLRPSSDVLSTPRRPGLELNSE